MSTYNKQTKHPITNEWEVATWADDYYGRHRYGVVFSNGDTFDPEKIKLETREEKIEEKQELHKWTWKFEHNVNYSMMSADGWKSVCIGFYKFTKTPEQGEPFGRKDYKGFIIRFSYWFPIRFN